MSTTSPQQKHRRPLAAPTESNSRWTSRRDANSLSRPTTVIGAVARRSDQLPSLAPIMDEMEVAGWSSNWHDLAGNFHDWLPLAGGRILLVAARALGPVADPIEAALVSQSVWTAVRAHATRATDPGRLLSLVAGTLGGNADKESLASLGAISAEPATGRANVAIAGDCAGLRIRAASTQRLPLNQAPLGAEKDLRYRSILVDLRPRERLALVAGLLPQETAACLAAITGRLASIAAESHRRMTAAETLEVTRQTCEKAQRTRRLDSVSMVVIRRR